MTSAARSSSQRSSPRLLELGLVGAILLLALFLRMGWPGLTEFKADEARLLARALELAQGVRFPIRGISSSVGFPNFPMSVWLYAIPLFLWQHVYAATLFTGLVNVLAVAASWWLVRRYWGPAAALVALLFFAVNPWAVFHARKIWAQNLLGPIIVGWGIAAILTFVERRPRFLVLHLLCLAVAVQVHFAALSLVPATLLFLFLFRRRFPPRILLVGIILSLTTALPFVYYLAQRAGAAADAGGLIAGLGIEAGSGLNVRSWNFLYLLTAGREIHSLAGPTLYRDYLASLPPLGPVHCLWAALALAGILWSAWRVRLLWPGRGKSDLAPPAAIAPASKCPDPGRRQAEAGFIVLAWLLFPAIFFTWFPVDVFLHYILPAYPAPFIIAGVAAALLLGRLRHWRWPAWILLALSAGVQVWATATLLNLVATNATPGGFGTPLAMKLEATTAAVQMYADLEAAEILIAGSGEDTATDAFAAVYDVLLRDTPHRFVNVQHSALFPAAPVVVLLAAEPGDRAAPIYLETASSRLDIPFRRGEGVLRVLALPAGSAPEPDHHYDPDRLFANWIELYGYSLSPVPRAEQVEWQLYWHPGAEADQAAYHFFNHLLDAHGVRIGQADAPLFSPGQWQPGDTVVSHFRLPLPPGAERPLTMRTGIYRYPSLEHVPILDVAGNPNAAAVEVQILE